MKQIYRLGKILLCCGAALLLASCAHVLDTHLQRHPLIGKVWDVAAQRFVDPARVMARAEAARYVLLGEIHDNAEHHRIQAQILAAMIQRGRRPALVMEQFDVEQQELLNTLAQGAQSQSDKLSGLAGLMRTSWEWRYYEPLVARALREKLPLIAANLSRTALREVSRNGFDTLGSGETQRLAIDAVWSDEKQQQLLRELASSHCGKIPDHVLDAIAKSQRARDAMMADMLLLTHRTGAVAIVGRGHARQDMGVPLYLEERAPDQTVLSVGLVDVDMPTDPLAYARGPLGQQHDYLWFTARPPRRSDPCDSIPVPAKAA
jgi:uncharacterized iron-regulated protein